jgi:hypothetical protein
MLDEYHITQHKINPKRIGYVLRKNGAKRATRRFNNGIELQQYIGWLVLNRPCRVIFYNEDRLGLKEIHSLNFINFVAERNVK